MTVWEIIEIGSVAHPAPAALLINRRGRWWCRPGGTCLSLFQNNSDTCCSALHTSNMVQFTFDGFDASRNYGDLITSPFMTNYMVLNATMIIWWRCCHSCPAVVCPRKVWQSMSMLFLQNFPTETYNPRWLELDNEMQYWICLTLLRSESKYISVDLVWVHLCSLQSIFHRCPCLQIDISQYFPAGRLILSHCTATNTLQNLFPQLSQLSLLTTDTQVKAKRIEAEINPWEETLLWEIWRLVGLCWWEHLSLGELPLVAGCRARSQCQLCSAAAFLHSSCPYLLLRNPPPTSPLSHRPCQAIWGLIWVWSKTLNGRKLIFDVAFFLSSCPYWLLPLHSLPLVTTHAPTQAPIAQSYRPAV